ncbi:hypothetical protein ACTHP3_21195 [Shouchella rhizosphaerae]
MLLAVDSHNGNNSHTDGRKKKQPLGHEKESRKEKSGIDLG